MLSLALRGKIAITEDVVTAAFFDELDEQRDVSLLRALIRGAHRSPDFDPNLAFESFAIELWPRIAAGEPDVRIRLLQNGVEIGRVLVEAKLGASKSGVGQLAEDGSSGDQLARYLVEESKTAPEVFILYLTHHAAIPADDLDESRMQLQKCGRSDLVQRLLWSSWRSVERAIDAPAYERVRELLRRAGMYWFDGMRTNATLSIQTAVPQFYVSNPVTYAWPPPPSSAEAPTFYRTDVSKSATTYNWPDWVGGDLRHPGYYGGEG